MGQAPPATMSFSKVARCVSPIVYWSRAQHHLNGMGLGTRLAIIGHDQHHPVGASHITHWMVEHGKAVLEHRHQGPPPATGTPDWDKQNNQAKGPSSSGK
eukprot:12101663-Karenia_brevis.AAC.1